MASTLQLVDTDLSTVLFDFNSSTGTGNPGSVITLFGAEGALSFFNEPEFVTIAPPSTAGGSVVFRRDTLGMIAWKQYITATSADNLLLAAGELARRLAEGGILKWIPHGSSETRYVYFEPSRTPVVYDGQPMGLWNALQRFSQGEEAIQISLTCQPYMVGAELAPALNLCTNPTLTHDFDATANRPDGWTWSATTGLTAETMTSTKIGGPLRGVYQFQKADGAAANLQQTTATSSYASGDVGVFSFYARLVSGNSCQMQATLQFKQSDGTTNVGSLHSGGLVSLTSAWQRLSVTSSSAGALTSRAQLSIQIDDTDANANVVQICNAQAEKTSLTPFRTSGAAVAYNPTSTSLPRKIAVWGEGNAPAPAKLKATADSLTMGRYRVYRVADKGIEIMKATLHKSLRSGTLGTDTASAANSEAADGNVARVTYTEPDPSFGTDSATSGTSTTTISLAPPASLAVGDCMVAIITSFRQTEVIAAPFGWSLGEVFRDALDPIASMHWWYKIADANDVAASTFDFDILVTGATGSDEYICWIGRFPNIDQVNPIDAWAMSSEGNTSAPTASSITTTANNHEIITAYGGLLDAGSGSLTFTGPAGSTPTYTEQDDRQATSTWKAMAVYTGLLATAGATGTKDATASGSGDFITLNLALRKATAVLQARSTVTWTGAQLPALEYDVWLRYRTSAACFDRLRVEYALKASPSTWIALPDFLVDARAATGFADFEEHLMGRLSIPDDQPLDTLTVRVSAGREATSSANLDLDIIYLAPVSERGANLTAPTVLASGEFFYTVPDKSGVFHLATDSDQSETAMCDGPTPVELAPGYQVLVVWPAVSPLAGYVDPFTEVTSSPTVTVTHSPRYRT